ncbi:hypothetical protein [Kozakia baliensis]|uniref:Uncharacterized protein n=1 Tax=Kozakia baliensis TaxID=153496 RepID=A0A1D8UV48_9PROT|nr:hypothetical protein [Kozakia baliensis]AOX17513.1 hypothetical protein A0U89_10580 [Kozakia baliensis]GBR30799.1 hypothetical protein AA0488_2101 [Kozakia baliensis NRIC 0488]GEL63019.1 hypothetical protein KBA01_03050 [Kozakia baliensis]
MKKYGVLLGGTVALLSLAAAPEPNASSHHHAGSSKSGAPAKSTTRYSDGTGNNMIDRLNNAQLDKNYKGPTYYRGQQQPPPFQAVPLSEQPEATATPKKIPATQANPHP